jgi:hypothetical protein
MNPFLPAFSLLVLKQQPVLLPGMDQSIISDEPFPLQGDPPHLPPGLSLP